MKRFILFGIFCMFSGMFAGCSTSHHLSDSYGNSYKACFNAQVTNPDAPENPTPVDGMPGYEATQVYNDIYLPGITKSGTGDIE